MLSAADMDADRWKKSGVKNTALSMAGTVLAQVRFALAGQPAGVWGNFGGMADHVTTLADVLLVGATASQGTAARILAGQSTQWQRLAKDRCVWKVVAGQLAEANLPRKQ